MAHARKQIRDAAVALLTGLPTTGANVQGNKFYNVTRTIDEVLRVFPKSEETEIPDMSKRKERSFILAVEAVIRASATTVEDLVDQVCVEVEEAMDGATLVGVESVGIVGTNFSWDGDVSKPIGMAEMLFEVIYSTREGLPEDIL